MTTNWRGAQCAPNASTVDTAALSLRGANLIRFPFDINYYDESAQILDNIISSIEPAKTQIVLNVRRPIEGTNPVTDLVARSDFKNYWSALVQRYKDNDTIIAYGILNEPVGSGQQVNQFMLELHQVIRSFDLRTRVVVTCPRSDPAQFHKTRFIKGDQNVWYEVHMYLPMALTHQGVDPRYPYPVSYPNANRGWNRAFLIDKLDDVRRFQNENRARIYAGEFGISTFTDDESRANYYRDCIYIFEKYGWNWTAHAWREAAVWNLETPLVLPVFTKAWGKND